MGYECYGVDNRRLDNQKRARAIGPLAYIGETEVISKRLKEHVKERDWWDTAVLITASEGRLAESFVDIH